MLQTMETKVSTVCLLGSFRNSEFKDPFKAPPKVGAFFFDLFEAWTQSAEMLLRLIT